MNAARSAAWSAAVYGVGFSGRGVRMVKAPAIRHRPEGRLRNRAHLVAPRPQIRTAAVNEHDRRPRFPAPPRRAQYLDGRRGGQSRHPVPKEPRLPPQSLPPPTRTASSVLRAEIASCMPLVHATTPSKSYGG